MKEGVSPAVNVTQIVPVLLPGQKHSCWPGHCLYFDSDASSCQVSHLHRHFRCYRQYHQIPLLFDTMDYLVAASVEGEGDYCQHLGLFLDPFILLLFKLNAITIK